MQHEHSTIHTVLQKWRNLAQATEVQKLATRLLPVIILWNLWENRCAEKYGAKQSNTAWVKFLIIKDFNHLLNIAHPYIEWPNIWNSLIEMVASYKYAIMVK